MLYWYNLHEITVPFTCLNFPFAMLESMGAALITLHSSALQVENLSCVKGIDMWVIPDFM